MVKIAKLILCLAWSTPNWLFAQEIKVAPLLSRDLTEFRAKKAR